MSKLDNMTLTELVKLQIAISRTIMSKLYERRLRSKTAGQNDSSRAARQPNEITIKDAVLNVLQRAGEGGLTKDEIARRVVSEESYKTEAAGDKWVRSVYQGGILPLVRDGVISRIGHESESSTYQVVV